MVKSNLNSDQHGNWLRFGEVQILSRNTFQPLLDVHSEEQAQGLGLELVSEPLSQLATGEEALNSDEKGRLDDILATHLFLDSVWGGWLERDLGFFLRSLSSCVGAVDFGIYGSAVAHVVAGYGARDVDAYIILPRQLDAMKKVKERLIALFNGWGIIPTRVAQVGVDALSCTLEQLDILFLSEESALRTYTSEDERLRIGFRGDDSFIWGPGLSYSGVGRCKRQITAKVCVFKKPHDIASLFFKLLHKELKGKSISQAERLYEIGRQQIADSKPKQLAGRIHNWLGHYTPAEYGNATKLFLEKAQESTEKLLASLPAELKVCFSAHESGAKALALAGSQSKPTADLSLSGIHRVWPSSFEESAPVSKWKMRCDALSNGFERDILSRLPEQKITLKELTCISEATWWSLKCDDAMRQELKSSLIKLLSNEVVKSLEVATELFYTFQNLKLAGLIDDLSDLNSAMKVEWEAVVQVGAPVDASVAIAAKEEMAPCRPCVEMPLNADESKRLRSLLRSSIEITSRSGRKKQIPIGAFISDFSARIGATRQGIFGSSVAKIVADKAAADVDLYFVIKRAEGSMEAAKNAFFEQARLWGASITLFFQEERKGVFLGVEGLDVVLLYEDAQGRNHTSDDEELRIEIRKKDSAAIWGAELSLEEIEIRKEQIRGDICIFRNPAQIYALFFRLVHKERKGKKIPGLVALYREGRLQILAMAPERLARCVVSLLRHYPRESFASVLMQMLERATDEQGDTKQGLVVFERLVRALPDKIDPLLDAMKAHPQDASFIWELRLSKNPLSIIKKAKSVYCEKTVGEKKIFLARLAAGKWFTDLLWLQQQRSLLVLSEKGESPRPFSLTSWIEKASNLPDDPEHREAWKWFLLQDFPTPKNALQHFAVATACRKAGLPSVLGSKEIYQLLSSNPANFMSLVAAMPDTEDAFLMTMKAHPTSASFLWRLRCLSKDHPQNFNITEMAKDDYRSRPDAEKPSYLRQMDRPWFTDTAWLEQQRHVCVLLEKGEKPGKLDPDAWLEKACNLPTELVHLAAWKWLLLQQVPVVVTEIQQLKFALATQVAKLPLAEKVREDLRALEANELGLLLNAEQQSDVLKQLELFYQLSLSPSFAAWLERKGARDLYAYSAQRLNHEPDLVGKLSWWNDAAYLARMDWKVLCLECQPHALIGDLVQLSEGSLLAASFCALSGQLHSNSPTFNSSFRKYLLVQVAKWRPQDCSELVTVLNALADLQKCGLIEDMELYKQKISVDLGLLLSERPSQLTATVAYMFYEPSFHDAAIPHLLEGYKIALKTKGRGERFTEKLGADSQPALMFAYFAKTDADFALTFARKNADLLGHESFEAMWQIASAHLPEFMPYFRRYLPSQQQLAELALSGQSLELFILSAAGGLDCSAHLAMIRKGARAGSFLDLQKEPEVLFELLSLDLDLTEEIERRVLETGSGDLALKLLQQLDRHDHLGFIRQLQEVETFDEAFWCEVALLSEEAGPLQISLSKLATISCGNLLQALELLPAQNLDALLKSSVRCNEDYQPFVSAYVRKRTQAPASLLEVCSDQMLLKFLPHIAEDLEAAIWEGSIKLPLLNRLLDLLLSHSISEKDGLVLGATLAVISEKHALDLDSVSILERLSAKLPQKLRAFQAAFGSQNLKPLLFASSYEALFRLHHKAIASACRNSSANPSALVEGLVSVVAKLGLELQEIFCEVALPNPAFNLKRESFVPIYETPRAVAQQSSSKAIFQNLYFFMAYTQSLLQEYDVSSEERFFRTCKQLGSAHAENRLLKFFLLRRASFLGKRASSFKARLPLKLGREDLNGAAKALQVYVDAFCHLYSFYEPFSDAWRDEAVENVLDFQNAILDVIDHVNSAFGSLDRDLMQRLYDVLSRPSRMGLTECPASELGPVLFQILDVADPIKGSEHLTHFLEIVAATQGWTEALAVLAHLEKKWMLPALLETPSSDGISGVKMIINCLHKMVSRVKPAFANEIRDFIRFTARSAELSLLCGSDIVKQKRLRAKLAALKGEALDGDFSVNLESLFKRIPQLQTVDNKIRKFLSRLEVIGPQLDPDAFEAAYPQRQALVSDLQRFCEDLAAKTV